MPEMDQQGSPNIDDGGPAGDDSSTLPADEFLYQYLESITDEMTITKEELDTFIRNSSEYVLLTIMSNKKYSRLLERTNLRVYDVGIAIDEEKLLDDPLYCVLIPFDDENEETHSLNYSSDISRSDTVEIRAGILIKAIRNKFRTHFQEQVDFFTRFSDVDVVAAFTDYSSFDELSAQVSHISQAYVYSQWPSKRGRIIIDRSDNSVVDYVDSGFKPDEGEPTHSQRRPSFKEKLHCEIRPSFKEKLHWEMDVPKLVIGVSTIWLLITIADYSFNILWINDPSGIEYINIIPLFSILVGMLYQDIIERK